MIGGPRLVLGSASPRRLELLAQVGVKPFDVRPSNIDETPILGELPRSYCARMAREKAEAVPLDRDEAVLCADTTVAVGRRILGKPSGRDEARHFLNILSGRRHRVITSVHVRRADRGWHKDVETVVKMKSLSEDERDAYLDTGDWRGKAGGYGIQGAAGALIPWIRGSFTGVVGLPLAETAGMLRAAGVIA